MKHHIPALLVCGLFLLPTWARAEHTMCESRWALTQGAVTFDSPADIPSFKRYTEPCAMKAGPTSGYVSKTFTLNQDTVAIRVYLYPSNATGLRRTVFRALDANYAEVFRVDLSGTTISLVEGSISYTLASAQVHPEEWNALRVSWSRGSPGYGRLSVGTYDGTIEGGRLIDTDHIRSYFTGNRSVRTIQLGNMSPASNMDVYFDGFVATTGTSRIALECRCDADASGSIDASDLSAISAEITGALLGKPYRAMGQPDCDHNGSLDANDLNVAAERISNILLGYDQQCSAE